MWGKFKHKNLSAVFSSRKKFSFFLLERSFNDQRGAWGNTFCPGALCYSPRFSFVQWCFLLGVDLNNELQLKQVTIFEIVLFF